MSSSASWSTWQEFQILSQKKQRNRKDLMGLPCTLELLGICGGLNEKCPPKLKYLTFGQLVALSREGHVAFRRCD